MSEYAPKNERRSEVSRSIGVAENKSTLGRSQRYTSVASIKCRIGASLHSGHVLAELFFKARNTTRVRREPQDIFEGPKPSLIDEFVYSYLIHVTGLS